MTDRLAERLLAYPSAAANCADMAALAAAAEQAVALVGMTAIASGMVTGPKAVSANALHFNNWPTAWLELYRAGDFLNKDPIPRHAVVSGASITWSKLKRELPANDPGHEVLAAVERHGFHEGMVTPVRTAAGHLGLVSVGGARGQLLPEECMFLESVCTATLHRAEALEQSAQQLPAANFTRRERECVTLLVQGLSEREIAARLGIKEVTARFHLDNARIKTGARSRTHLAGIAALWLTRKNEGPL